MANRDMKLDVLIRLRDQMTGGLRKMEGSLARVSQAARKIGAVGAIISGISFIGPMSQAAAFEQQLIDIAGTAELTGKAAFQFVDEMKARYENMSLVIGQSSQTIAEGAGLMIAAGVDVAQVEASLQAIGRAATAANADFNDMAGVATSMLINLKLPAQEMEDALGGLVMAGKLGSFELKDMAREFPSLTSQVAKLGLEGRDAMNFLGSALQIAMKGAAMPTVAANNLERFLGTALSPRVVKNFSDMVVNIGAVMMDAAAKGMNPLEAVIEKVQKLTGVSQQEINKYMTQAKENGLEGSKALDFLRQQLEKIGAAEQITQLFNDKSSLDFLIPMLANVDEYLDIKSQVAKASGAMTDADFKTQIEGINRQMEIFKEIGTQASREMGLAFGAWLPMINQGLMVVLTTFREWDEKLGGWLKAGLMVGAGFALLAVDLGAVGLALPIITAGFDAVGAIVAALFTPIGAVVALLAGAGYLIYRNWEVVAPYLKAFWQDLTGWAVDAWQTIKGIWAGFAPALASMGENFNQTFASLGQTWENISSVAQDFAAGLQGVGSALIDLANGLGQIMGFDDGMGEGFALFLGQIAGGIGQLLSSGIKIVADMLQIITGTLRFLGDLVNGRKPDWKAYFPDWLVTTIEAIVAAVDKLVEGLKWLGNQGQAIVAAVGDMIPDPTKLLPTGFVEGSKQAMTMMVDDIGSAISRLKADSAGRIAAFYMDFFAGLAEPLGVRIRAVLPAISPSSTATLALMVKTTTEKLLELGGEVNAHGAVAPAAGTLPVLSGLTPQDVFVATMAADMHMRDLKRDDYVSGADEALSLFIRGGLLVSAALVTLEIDFVSRAQAIDVRSQITQALNGFLNALQTPAHGMDKSDLTGEASGLYRAAQDVKLWVIADLNEIIGRLPMTKRIDLRQDTDAFVLANHLYGDDLSAIEAGYVEIVA